MRTSRPPRRGSSGVTVGGRLEPATLPPLLRATHLFFGLALGSALVEGVGQGGEDVREGRGAGPALQT